MKSIYNTIICYQNLKDSNSAIKYCLKLHDVSLTNSVATGNDYYLMSLYLMSHNYVILENMDKVKYFLDEATHFAQKNFSSDSIEVAESLYYLGFLYHFKNNDIKSSFDIFNQSYGIFSNYSTFEDESKK